MKIFSFIINYFYWFFGFFDISLLFWRFLDIYFQPTLSRLLNISAKLYAPSPEKTTFKKPILVKVKNCVKCVNAPESSGSIHSYHYFLHICCAPTSLIAYCVLQKLEYCVSIPKLKHDFDRISNIFHNPNIISFKIAYKLLFTYCIFSNKRPRDLVSFEGLKCSANWTTALERGSCLFQSKKNYSYKISKLCNFIFSSNNIHTIMISSLAYPRTTTFFLHFFMFVYLFDMYFGLVMFRLWSHFGSGAGAYYRVGLIWYPVHNRGNTALLYTYSF